MEGNKQTTEKTTIKCHVCNHSWGTKSKLKLVSCPSCLNKVKNNIVPCEVVEDGKERARNCSGESRFIA